MKKKTKTLDSFLARASTPKKTRTLDSFLAKVSTPKKNPTNVSFDLNQSNFGDENDLEVSDIVDEIVKRDLPSYVPKNLEKLGLKLECSFFMSEMSECDLFEKTFNTDWNTE